MSGKATIAEALSLPDGITSPSQEKLIEIVEELPWKTTWVESSTIRRIAWRETDRIPYAGPEAIAHLALGWLWIEFHRGEKAYAYMNVPRPLYAAIVAAQSPGNAHAELIKSNYDFAAIDLRNGQTFVKA